MARASKSQLSQIDKMAARETAPMLIGQGTAGCVYRPSIPCQEGQSGRGKVSKILSAQAADAELEIYHSLNFDEEDPDEKYTIKKPRRCPLTGRYLPALKASGCKVKITDPTNLIYTDGGEDFYKYSSRETNPALVLRPLVNIFYIVYLLNSRGKYHMDIKPNNIVIENSRARLVDFGLAINQKPINPAIYNAVYPFWPPEVLLMDPEAKEKIYDKINPHLKRYHERLNEDGIAPLMEKWGIKLRELMYSIQFRIIMDPPSYDDIAPKADGWGLALTVIFAVNNSMKNMTPAAREHLREILHRMLADDEIRERPTAKQAYIMYKDFIDKHYP